MGRFPVVIPVQMDVARQAEMNIAKAIEEEQRIGASFATRAVLYECRQYGGSARPYRSLPGIDGSSWYSHWVRAQILHGLGKDDMAKEVFNALELGEAGAKEKGNEFSTRHDPFAMASW